MIRPEEDVESFHTVTGVSTVRPMPSNFEIQLIDSMAAVGFRMTVMSELDSLSDTVFEIQLFRNGELVDEVRMQTAPLIDQFVGIQSDVPFDAIRIEEIVIEPTRAPFDPRGKDDAGPPDASLGVKLFGGFLATPAPTGDDLVDLTPVGDRVLG